MATVLLTTEEASAATRLFRQQTSRALFLYLSALHNKTRAEKSRSMYLFESDPERARQLSRIHSAATSAFYARMAEHHELLIDAAKRLYLQG